MALLDRERNVIVLRVVYDGPPEAGKTTSLRALAGSLGQALYSPAEQDGRTLYFDWMDYTGGRFDGYQIRCQIVSVPGQPELAARRHRLLREADTVVFVADSTRLQIDRTVELLGELPRLTSDASAPPVGVVLQANKRDLPDALPIADVRLLLREAGLNMGVVEAVAADGTGIRETFVFAVRLALDRVREQLREHSLPSGRPEIDSGQALLEQLEEADGRTPPRLGVPMAAPLLEQVLAENDERQLADFAPWRASSPAVTAESDCSDEADAPLPPDPAAPSGAIWPPVEGRLILHEASASPMSIHRLRNGGWAAGLGNGWRVYSSGSAAYGDLDAGREMLIRWARLHVACGTVLSYSRCIVMAATGQGTWRLWQIVRAEKSLRDYLDDLQHCTTEEAAQRIVEAVTLLGELSARLQSAPCHVPCSLDTVGRGERGAVYVGLMPSGQPGPTDLAPAETLIASELESILNSALYSRRAEVLAAITRARRSGGAAHSASLAAHLFEQMAAS